MSHTPTPEQAAIVAAAKTTTDNLIVQALAGAAKTSTLVMLAEALPTTAMLCLAFNKRIAVEMTERLPPNCIAMTLNGLGHRVWSDFIGKRLIVDTKKTYNILNKIVQGLSDAEKEEVFPQFSEIMQMIDAGKTCGYIPTGKYPLAKRLMDDDEFFAWLDEPPSYLQERLIREVTCISIEQALGGVIDFNDQIILPTVYPATFPQYPLVLVDEAQDLSALNHATLKKLAKKRIIAVGDECQSIYGFRGAHENSMTLLRETFNMRPLILSVSFRCPRSVVREAQWRAPHMRYPDWAVEGEVTRFDHWDESNIPDGAAIICRNNAPLFTMAIKLLKGGRYPQLLGNDIGKYLIKVMKKLGPVTMSRDTAMQKLETWQDEKLKKHRNPGKVHDQVSCIKIFFEQADTIGGAINYANYLFNSQGPILLMTGHKAKGLEYDDVFILDQELIRMDEDQDRNLKYVMQTRAKKRLCYIATTLFVEDKSEEAA